MKAVDNPDQRVQEDVGIYTERTINLTYNACHEVRRAGQGLGDRVA